MRNKPNLLISSRLSQLGLRLFCGVAALACASARYASADSTDSRIIESMDKGWKFIRQDVGVVANADGGDWTSVDLPHTWNGKDGEDGSESKQADYYRGVGWYQRHFKASLPEYRDKRLFLKFDGACAVTDVYINGKPAGHHEGMFAAFCFDITELVNFRGDNVIAVKVSNAKNADLPPLQADFTFFGGIYRDVNLIALDPICISPIDDASSGVYAKQTGVSAEAATLQVTTKLLNDTGKQSQATVETELLDAAGKSVAKLNIESVPLPTGSTDVAQTLSISKPHLWNGRKDPFLYQLAVTVTSPQHTKDRVIEQIGFRDFKADPDKGFLLNGASYPLHGVNRHQDRPHKGWAISEADHKEDFDLIMEMGCTGIRLAHYQHAQEFYDLCDSGGLVVWAEACLVDLVTPSKAFDDNAKTQLRELIKQNYNHPSIYCWSLFNELGDHGLKGDELDAQRKHQLELVAALNDEAHQLDPSRPTVGASNFTDPSNALNKITDVIGFNRYSGWYSNGNWPEVLDKLRSGLPGKAISISEYGAGASVHQHEYPVDRPKTTGAWHPEEYQCTVHEAAYAAMKERPWLWGTFLWNMFDFAADSRKEGERAGINDKGMVTYDRKTRKDVFYFYKANWASEPFVYITDRRFTPRPVGDAPIKIYSNCDSVELKLNGVSQGSKTSTDHIFIWDHVAMKPGDNSVEAVTMQSGKKVTDSCTVKFDQSTKIERATQSIVGDGVAK